MSFMPSVILATLSMVIFAFLQLPSGLFLIFYHVRLSKTSQKKTDDAALSFILGTEIFATTIWLLTYFITFGCFYYNPEIITAPFLFVMAGICFAEAIAMLFFYFRRGKSSMALFLPRKIARNLVKKSETVKSRSDAIMLGFMSSFPELLFTLPLFIACTMFLQNEDALSRAFIIILSVISTVIPLFAIRFLFQSGYNLAGIERLRIKFKPHFRLILFLAYLTITLLLLNLAIMKV